MSNFHVIPANAGISGFPQIPAQDGDDKNIEAK